MVSKDVSLVVFSKLSFVLCNVCHNAWETYLFDRKLKHLKFQANKDA